MIIDKSKLKQIIQEEMNKLHKEKFIEIRTLEEQDLLQEFVITGSMAAFAAVGGTAGLMRLYQLFRPAITRNSPQIMSAISRAGVAIQTRGRHMYLQGRRLNEKMVDGLKNAIAVMGAYGKEQGMKLLSKLSTIPDQARTIFDKIGDAVVGSRWAMMLKNILKSSAEKFGGTHGTEAGTPGLKTGLKWAVKGSEKGKAALSAVEDFAMNLYKKYIWPWWRNIGVIPAGMTKKNMESMRTVFKSEKFKQEKLASKAENQIKEVERIKTRDELKKWLEEWKNLKKHAFSKGEQYYIWNAAIEKTKEFKGQPAGGLPSRPVR